MKKIIMVLLLLCFLSPLGGCNNELLKENQELKEKIIQLEKQLQFCNEIKKETVKDAAKYDPSITNPNDNARY